MQPYALHRRFLNMCASRSWQQHHDHAFVDLLHSTSSFPRLCPRAYRGGGTKRTTNLSINLILVRPAHEKPHSVRLIGAVWRAVCVVRRSRCVCAAALPRRLHLFTHAHPWPRYLLEGEASGRFLCLLGQVALRLEIVSPPSKLTRYDVYIQSVYYTGSIYRY